MLRSETATNPRRADYLDYKPWTPEPRDHTPFEWLPTIAGGLDAVSVQCSEARSYEADDDVATLAASASSRRVGIMSADQDFLQLVDRRVRLLTPRRIYSVADVVQRFDIHPRQWCDYRALTGDPSDNVRGIRDIGPKRAAYVLYRRRAIETARIPDTWWGRRLRDEQAAAIRWRDLMTLRTDQDVALAPTGHGTRELPKAAQICDLLSLWD